MNLYSKTSQVCQTYIRYNRKCQSMHVCEKVCNKCNGQGTTNVKEKAMNEILLLLKLGVINKQILMRIN